MNYWFVKSPYKHRIWDNVIMSGIFKLYGIRNYQSKNNIARMQTNDKALYYSSSAGKKVFGIMQVSKKPYIDPTTNNSVWLSVDFQPIKTFENPITLEQIKAEAILKNLTMLKQLRVLVTQITKKEYEKIISLIEQT